ncbi:hypothetical protein Gotur_036090 [Gossypium turneri]
MMISVLYTELVFIFLFLDGIKMFSKLFICEKREKYSG